MRLRSTTRRALFAVAVVALVPAGWREWRYAWQHERSLRIEADCWEQAAVRRREQAYCLDQARRGTPYDPLERQKTTGYLHISMPPEFRDWTAEAAEYAKWAAVYEQGAEEAEARRRLIERGSFLH